MFGVVALVHYWLNNSMAQGVAEGNEAIALQGKGSWCGAAA
jgi:hypothetical protein